MLGWYVTFPTGFRHKPPVLCAKLKKAGGSTVPNYDFIRSS
jgi:hypothetical protein